MSVDSSIADLLRSARTIAVVGLSDRRERPSHEVAAYLQSRGYRIVPVNPSHAGSRILGEHCYATLTQAAEVLGAEMGKIDIVNCFRRSEHIGPIVDEALVTGALCIWMQLGVVNEEAAQRARAAGLLVVMDRCLKIEHRALFGH